MSNSTSDITKEFVKLIFLQTHNKNYALASLASIKNEKNMQIIIDYIKETPNATLSMIEEKIMNITGVI